VHAGIMHETKTIGIRLAHGGLLVNKITPVATCSVIRHPASSSQESFTPLVLTTLDFLTTRPRKVHFRSSLGRAPAQVFLALFLPRSPPRLLTVAAWR
jgi:hypothetical protein